MLINANELTDNTTLEADVCVVGAGAAGITVAKSLKDARKKIILVEGGGLEFDQATQDLYDGLMKGPTSDGNAYLSYSRLRYFGGSTNHWAGMCRPLAPYDLEGKPWVKDSAWPIDYKELASHYDAACAMCDIRSFEGNEDEALPAKQWWPTLPVDASDSSVETRLFHHSIPPTRFGQKYRKELADAPSVKVLLNANCIELTPTKEVNRIREIEAVTLARKKVRIRANRFVLAAGGLETCRLLLNSDRVARHGVGNDFDQVGRYFMEHPIVLVGGCYVWDARGLLRLYTWAPRDYRNGGRSQAMLSPTEKFRRENKTQAAFFFLSEAAEPNESLAGAVKKVCANVDRASRKSGEGFRPLGPAQSLVPAQYFMLRAMTEQVPNFDSRVTLIREKDVLGVRKLHLDWRLTAEDYRSAWLSSLEIAKAFQRNFLGRVRIDLQPDAPKSFVLDTGKHHMGTTRMSESPRLGVVDKNCRVHGIENLYIAGSSIFPTGGAANPTLSLVALAIRLGRHLAAMGD